MEGLSNFLAVSNGILWAEPVLYTLLGTGVLFTIWSGFAQYRALTHGSAVVRGKYDNPDDPGAISHFQALSAALSATVGLGNIGGVALAIALGGPGAVFWMWIVGLVGMAIKITEVTLSMLYRNTDDPDNPHGGPMWVITKGLPEIAPGLAGVGKAIGVIFCLTLLVSTATGGNMFQAWNVGEITEAYFGVPSIVTGIILAVIVGSVIIGGIKRIGAVAGTLVPFMVALYLIAGTYVLVVNADQIPAMFALIVTGAFNPQEATGAFIGGTVAYGFLIGMKRALFSNEAGQGSSPIAHSAAKTDEPVREGVVAGLEPFIDTIVVCTFTALIILSTGVWNRSADGVMTTEPFIAKVSEGVWQIESTPAPVNDTLEVGTQVYVIVEADPNDSTGNNLHKVSGTIVEGPTGPLVE
ncbi:MAG: amino acid carrier protein, partial [Pseudomonadota bacterium]